MCIHTHVHVCACVCVCVFCAICSKEIQKGIKHRKRKIWRSSSLCFLFVRENFRLPKTYHIRIRFCVREFSDANKMADQQSDRCKTKCHIGMLRAQKKCHISIFFCVGEPPLSGPYSANCESPTASDPQTTKENVDDCACFCMGELSHTQKCWCGIFRIWLIRSPPGIIRATYFPQNCFRQNICAQAPKPLQASERSELLDRTRASCGIFAQH